MRNGAWVIAYNTGAGDYSDPYFVAQDEIDIDPGCFGGHGHTSYATFGSEQDARQWADPLGNEAERYMQERAEFDRQHEAYIAG